MSLKFTGQFCVMKIKSDTNVLAKKSIEELCLMAVNIDAKFEGKLTCAF